ncbi:MAG: aminoglycoside 3'-phosphotransferase [Clostridiales bacterium]|nr:aminoglycoside 3'-phosphotransferase [Clostridiales bacterium]
MLYPPDIQRLIAGMPGIENHVGLSGSRVICYPDRVLKIEPVSEEARNETAMMRWMQGRLPAPAVLAEAEESGLHYLLMSRIGGKMFCDTALLEDPDRLLDCAVEALQALWRQDIAQCPVDRGLSERLRLARQRVEAGLCGTEDVQPGTYGDGGFASPMALLGWLEQNRPEEDLFLTHGDCCLPNLFADENGFCGFIDLGRSGVGDRWQDIALLYRSLRHNYDGSHGYTAQAECPADRLFERLGIELDHEKLHYYLLLDELF